MRRADGRRLRHLAATLRASRRTRSGRSSGVFDAGSAQIVPSGMIPGWHEQGGKQEALARTSIRTVPSGASAAVRAGHAEHRQADVGADDQCGSLGWVTDKDRGYRYQPQHPVTGSHGRPCRTRLSNSGTRSPGRQRAGSLSGQFLCRGCQHGPASGSRRTGFGAPVLSISLGDTCLFRVGGTNAATDRVFKL